MWILAARWPILRDIVLCFVGTGEHANSYSTQAIARARCQRRQGLDAASQTLTHPARKLMLNKPDQLVDRAVAGNGQEDKIARYLFRTTKILMHTVSVRGPRA